MRSGTSTQSFGTIIALTCVVLAAAPRSADSAEEKLVAPVYPGAARLSGTTLARDKGVVFFVRDPHEKVQAYYVPKYARLPKKSEGRVRGAAEIPLIVQSGSEVTKIIIAMKGDSTWARPTEIIVEWKPPVFAGTGLGAQFFKDLQDQAEKHPGHDAELAALKAKHSWLDLAYLHPEKKAEELYKRCSSESQGVNPNVDQAALVTRYAKLAQEGKYDEMAKIQEQLVGSDPRAEERKRQADNFGLWKGCLEEAGGLGYLTKITIDRDPHQWDTKWK